MLRLWLFVYVIAVAMSLLSCFQLATAWSNQTEKLALLKIKDEISDPLGVMNSWNDTLHYCNWYGVTCGKFQGVTKLDLHSSKLTGTISPHLGNLSFLRDLNLETNLFHGTIPPQIGRLQMLHTLLLFDNNIGGEIPSNLSSCHKLININLTRNVFMGELPPSLGSLSNLQFLSLRRNNLTGNIPESFGNLSSLSVITIAENYLVGGIPNSLGNLRNLTSLRLADNKFHGLVPSSIYNLSLLTELSLQRNELKGNLPSDLGNTLPRLKLLYMGVNQFTGHIPASTSNLSNMEYLQFDQNFLLGQVPSLQKLVHLSRFVLYNNSLGYDKPGDLDFIFSLANASSLEWLEIDYNKFDGVFPEIICNFTSLTLLTLRNNNVVGKVPSCISNLINLQRFMVSSNKLSGVIPESIGMLQNLFLLYLDENQFSGVIPHSIGNLTFLSDLHLNDNRLEGQIPSTLGNCTSLTRLLLSNNNLSGKIPPQVLSLSSLSFQLDLSKNHLSGSLPEDVGKLINLEVLLVHQNKLSGQIPSSLGKCIALEYLYLAKNNFQGMIPDALQSLGGLLELDLSYNNLSGQIPQYMENLQGLRLLNVSHNRLEGEVPIGGVFSNATNVLLSGNTKLCGGIPELNLPPCNLSVPKRSNHVKRLAIVIVSSLLGVALLLAFLLLLSIFRQRNKETPTFDHSENIPLLSYQTLHKATNGFSLENRVGSGTFGVVYKGFLEEYGSNVAVKVFNLEYHSALKSFIAECQVLRRIRHRNLLKVKTACSGIDNHGKDFKALVYEYMVNMSLEHWLHPTERVNVDEDATITSRYLNFRQRLDIAVDVASALDYLHHHGDTTIVHCDLKPSNVLLDEELVAHIGDFGLAKILRKGSINNTLGTSQSSSIGVRGTIGYAPPEYGLGNEPSTYGDVYSFGILLLEMFTGLRPTNGMFKGELSLRSFVEESLAKDTITTLLDHVLLKDIDEENMETRENLEALIHIFKTALLCSNDVPKERLDMSDVVKKLSSIKSKLSHPLELAYYESGDIKKVI